MYEKNIRNSFFVCKVIINIFVGLHLEFLTTKCGLLKIFELLLGEFENNFYESSCWSMTFIVNSRKLL